MNSYSKNKTSFDYLILASVGNCHIIPNTVYYDSFYINRLKNDLEQKGLLETFEKRELQEKIPGKPKMGSVASSSRLCYVHNRQSDNSFEWDLNTGVRSSIAHLDMFDNNQTYFECKCHEIFDDHAKNKDSLLKQAHLEKINEIFCLNYQTKEQYLYLSLRDFGIVSDTSIYDLCFDMKQFICHLLGLSKNNGGKLQYIFYTPKTELIEINEWCKEVYAELKSEISLIWNSPVIMNMCNNYHIDLLTPKMIPVDSFSDFILK